MRFLVLFPTMIILLNVHAQELNQLISKKSDYDLLCRKGEATEKIFARDLSGSLRRMEDVKTEDITITYNLFSFEDRFIRIGVYEKTGDWSGEHLYYFDQEGNVFSYVHAIGTVGSKCADTLNQVTSYYFDENFDILNQEIKLFNESGKSMKSDSCVFNSPYKHYFYANMEEFMLKVENYQAIDKRN